MNTWTLSTTVVSMLGSNPLLARLAFVSIELALLSIGVALLICLLRIRAPRVRALLWLLVLAKPILGLTIGTPLPLFHLQTAQPVAAVAPVAAEPSRETALDVPVVAHSPAEGPILAPKPVVEPETPLPSQPQTASSAPPVVVPRKPLPVGNLLVCLWLLGAIGLTGLTLHDQFQIRRIRRAGLTPPDALARRFRELAEALQIKHCPRLRLTDALQSSALAGLWRPDVLLPRWLAEEKNSQRLDWMIRHELMHLRLNDPVALVIRRLAEILFYFHPAVWWAGRKWEEAMELACDRALLQSDADARTYAEQLYRILESQSARRRPAPLGGGLFATRTQIGKRIAALLSDPLRSPAHLSLLALGGLALVALISLPVGFGLVHAQSTKPPTEKAIPSAVTDNPASPAIPTPEGKPQPPREISGDFVFDKEIPLYVQMATADGKGNASLQWIRFARYGEYWFGDRKNANNVGVDLRVVLGLANAKWRIELSLLDPADSSVARVETIYEDHAITSAARYITDANIILMIPLPEEMANLAKFHLRLEQAPADAAANAQFIYPWSSRERETKIVWGREANGLRAAIEFIPERQAYSLGEKIGVCFHVQNVGTRTLTGGLPRIAPCRAVVKDAKGNNVPTDISNLAQIAGSTEFRLAPGQEVVMRTKDLCFGARQPIAEESGHSYDVFVRSGDGRYFVQFFSSVEEVRNLEAGVREVIVVLATAAAKHLNSPVGDIRETTEITVIGSTVSPSKTPLVWGKEVNGLRASIEFIPERQVYAVGEKIGVFFRVQNVSTRTITGSLPRTAPCRAVVKDTKGNKVPPLWVISNLEQIAGYMEFRLAPGEEIVMRTQDQCFGSPLSWVKELGDTYDVLVRDGDAGRYFVQFFCSLGEGNDLGSGVRELVVVPAMAEEIHASKPNEGVRATTETSTRLPADTAPKTRLVWGKAVNGLRAALEFVPEKASYAFGEPIGTNFHVQNVSTLTVSLAYGQAGLFVPAVEDGNGKTQKVETFFPYAKPRFVRQVLAPGQEIVILNNGLLFKTPSSGITEGSGSHVLCDGPGRYSVHYNLRFRTYSQLLGKAGDSPDAGRNGPQQEDWQGELETGVREVAVVAATTAAEPAPEPNADVREAGPTAGRSLVGAVAKTADNPLGLNEDIEWKFFDTKRGFNIIQYGLISYCSNNHALPTKLADLNRSHMGDLPQDPFDAGPLRVIIEPNKVILASVGPDGKWDGGKAINPADPTLAGDVVYELTMETVEQLDLLDKVFQPFLSAMRPPSERGRMRPVSTPDPQRPNIVWGPEVKGLRAALEFVPEKKTYALGDLVGIRFHVQNVSSKMRQLAFTELLQGSGFVAVDEKGKAYAAYNCYSLGSWPRLQRRVLKPGEDVVLEYGHVCLGKLVNTPATAAPADLTPPDPKTIAEGIAISCSVDVPPGRYFLWHDLRLPDTGGSEVLEKDDWRGTVQTGVREVMIGPLVAGAKEGSDPTASAR